MKSRAFSETPENPGPLFITTSRGLEPLLEKEIADLGLPITGRTESGIHSRGGWPAVRALNLSLRTAHRVFWQAGAGPARTPEDLYQLASRIPWEARLTPDTPFRVTVSLELRDSANERYCALKVKDAVADRLRNRFGQRPDSGADPHALPVFVRWSASGEAVFYYDTSGVPLSFRGYRNESGPAPLRESLAAGLILWSGWDRKTPLISPMCGRGGLAIEAAWIAMNRAPGLGRDFFAFERFADHDRDAWQEDRQAVRRRTTSADGVPPLIASDNRSDAIAAAERNARRAGVDGRIQFELCEFEKTPIPDGPRWIVINPPYGQRLGEEEEIAALYPEIGRWLRAVGGPGRAVIISGNRKAVRQIGLKSERRTEMDNGPISCRVIEFPLFAKEP